MSPTIVYGPDGRVRIAIGAAGGPTIIAQVAKALIGVLDWHLSAQDAIALPQIMGWGNRRDRGARHLARGDGAAAACDGRPDRRWSAPGYKANAIERVDGRWVGAADPRSEGAWLAQ